MKIRFTAILFAFAIPVVFASALSGQDKQEKPEPPKSKQTSLGLYLTSKQAMEKWQSAPDKIKVLDVRTPEEYLYIGHAEMAWNIPLAYQTYQWDPSHKYLTFEKNPDFLKQVKEIADPEDTILMMCRSGGRSAKAVEILAEAGFKNVYNVIDGMEGDTVKDSDSLYYGKRMKNGWKNSGLPWTYKVNPDKMRLPLEKSPSSAVEAATDAEKKTDPKPKPELDKESDK